MSQTQQTIEAVRNMSQTQQTIEAVRNMSQTQQTIEAVRISWFLLSYEDECGRRNSLYTIRVASFVSIVMYLTCIIMML